VSECVCSAPAWPFSFIVHPCLCLLHLAHPELVLLAQQVDVNITELTLIKLCIAEKRSYDRVYHLGDTGEDYVDIKFLRQ